MYYYFTVFLIGAYIIGHSFYIRQNYKNEKRFMQWHIIVMLFTSTLIFTMMSALYPLLTGQHFNPVEYLAQFRLSLY